MVALATVGCSFLVDTTGLIGLEPVESGTDAPAEVAMPLDAPTDVADAAVEDAKTFPPGAKVFPANGHGYLLVLDPDKPTWDEAKARAIEMGGHLATITSAAENAFAYSLCEKVEEAWPGGYGPWLGGYQPMGSREPDGNWQWVTGEPFVFTAWQADEPSNSAGGESRIHFWGGNTGRAATWNDDTESFRGAAFIVEFEP